MSFHQEAEWPILCLFFFLLKLEPPLFDNGHLPDDQVAEVAPGEAPRLSVVVVLLSCKKICCINISDILAKIVKNDKKSAATEIASESE